MFRTALALVWVLAAVCATLPGMDYYLLPLQDRPFVPDHDLMASSGALGHGYGVVGTFLMVLGVVTYSVRKRARSLARLGKLKHWLESHIFLCTLGPYLVLLHTTFRFGGIVAVSFWSMVLVVASGVFGRYLYVRIPKTIHGHFLSLKALEDQREGTVGEIRARLGGDPEAVDQLFQLMRPTRTSGALSALAAALRWDMGKRGRAGRFRRFLAEREVLVENEPGLFGLLEAQGKKELQVALLHPFQRLFRYWHVFHLPLAIVMFLVLGVHVTVAVLFGYAWIF